VLPDLKLMQTNVEGLTSAEVLKENTRLVERFYEEANVKIREDLISPHFTGRAPGVTFDRASFIRSLTSFINAFPDGNYVNEYSVSEGDRVVTVGNFSGTHLGEFQGMKPTGRKVSILVVHADRVQDSKIVEHLRISDQMGLMKQLQQPPGNTHGE
jgi:predicted ester cyclase